MDYVKQAKDFLARTETTFKVVYETHDRHFPDDKESRDIYRIYLKNGRHKCSFFFGQSIANQGKTPTEYDILACLTKSDPGTFNEFISEFGYDVGTITKLSAAKKIYNGILKEWGNVQGLWAEDEITELQEIN